MQIDPVVCGVKKLQVRRIEDLGDIIPIPPLIPKPQLN